MFNQQGLHYHQHCLLSQTLCTADLSDLVHFTFHLAIIIIFVYICVCACPSSHIKVWQVCSQQVWHSKGWKWKLCFITYVLTCDSYIDHLRIFPSCPVLEHLLHTNCIEGPGPACMPWVCVNKVTECHLASSLDCLIVWGKACSPTSIIIQPGSRVYHRCRWKSEHGFYRHSWHLVLCCLRHSVIQLYEWSF